VVCEVVRELLRRGRRTKEETELRVPGLLRKSKIDEDQSQNAAAAPDHANGGAVSTSHEGEFS
jgi:hypothetical protein